MKRSTPLKRTGEIKCKRMRRGPSKNSQPHRDKDAVKQYREDHPKCLLCRNPSDQIHHLKRGAHRWDIPANMVALCGGCHADCHGMNEWEWLVRCYAAKLAIGEFDVVALDRIGGRSVAGMLDKFVPELGTETWSLREQLVQALGES